MTRDTSNTKFRTTYILLLLSIMMAAGIIIYSKTFDSPFIFDDIDSITKEKAVHMTQLSWGAIKNAASEGFCSHRYLPNISFAVNYYFGQLNPFGYHLFNLIIHLTAGIFLFFFIKNTLRIYPDHSEIHPELIAFFATLLWIVQPLATQSVTYIVQRMASMVALFYILSLLLYVKGRMAMRRNPGHRLIPGIFFIGCAISTGCAIATKQNAATLPLAIILYEWFFFQNLKLNWSRRQILWIGFFIIVFVGLVFWYLGENPMQRIFTIYGHRNFTLIQRIMTEWRIMIYYISLLLWAPPGRLNLDHDYPLSLSPIHPATTMLAFAAIISLLALAAYSAKKDRLIAFCIFWFFITQAIESTIIGLELIFEHRTYLSFMMISLLFVMLTFRLVRNRPVAVGLLITATLMFSFWTYQRNQAWQDPVTFWTDCAVKSPGKSRSYKNLGVELDAVGDIYGAIIQYKRAIAIDPNDCETYFNLGSAFNHQEDLDKAISCFMRALELKPDHIETHNNLANMLMQKGDIPGAISHFQVILNKHPDHVEANINMGAALARLGQIDAAIRHYQTALKSDPNNPEAHNNMGVLLAQKRMFTEALEQFKRALALRPGYVSAINNIRRLEQMRGYKE